MCRFPHTPCAVYILENTTLIDSPIPSGVRVTGSPGIKDDLIDAGGIWSDASVVVDRHFVCSRRPDDLPDFCKGIFEVIMA